MQLRKYSLLQLIINCSSSNASFFCSHDGKYITAGSENQCVFLWRTHYEPNNLTVRKDRNSYYEAIKGKIDNLFKTSAELIELIIFFSAHSAVVTCSVFAPNPALVFDQLEQNSETSDASLMLNESKGSTSLSGGGNGNHSTSPTSANAAGNSSESKFNSNASFKSRDSLKPKDKSNPGPGYVVISGDYDGEIKIFYNAVKPKHSSLPAT